jgi:ketosteroid isomerase-like protein
MIARHRRSVSSGLLFLAVVAAGSITATARAQDSTPVKPIDQIVAAERSFSAMSLEKSMRDAFVMYLANDGIVFRPLPVLGKPVWEARTATPSKLVWEPSRAEASAAGDLGWTTGPWEFRPPADSTGAPPPADQIAHGHFTTVWAKQADGQWRAAIDIGITHAKPDSGDVGSGALVLRPEHTWTKGVKKTPAARANLAAVERVFTADTKKKGTAALDDWATSDVRFNRDGEFPVEGRAATKKALSATADLVRFVPAGSRVSASDDLGYTYGVAERVASRSEAPDSSVYMHVWRKEADRKWRIAVIVENPIKK